MCHWQSWDLQLMTSQRSKMQARLSLLAILSNIAPENTISTGRGCTILSLRLIYWCKYSIKRLINSVVRSLRSVLLHRAAILDFKLRLTGVPLSFWVWILTLRGRFYWCSWLGAQKVWLMSSRGTLHDTGKPYNPLTMRHEDSKLYWQTNSGNAQPTMFTPLWS